LQTKNIFDDLEKYQSLRFRAIELHKAGQLEEAATIYERALALWEMIQASTSTFTTPVSFDQPYFGFPVDRFIFLASFGFVSYRARKNPEATITVFMCAFPDPHDQVGLVIKCHVERTGPEYGIRCSNASMTTLSSS
jgi:hypothetical protein